MALFVGRVSSSVRSKDIEDLFRKYGPLKRCEVKGTYAFVTFDDDRDAEDAVKELQGHDLFGSRINIEWAKGSGRYSDSGSSRGRGDRDDKKCFTCGERGHFARDCRRSRRRSRSRSRSRRRRSRSRSRSKSRSRDRRSRSRSRDRRRERSRSRGRDRSKDRRSKERSKDRSKSRERSAERSASRSRSRGRKRERSASPAREDEPDAKRQKLSPSGADREPVEETSHKED